jgi:phospholipid/cholesterol/gamma-HCH transport system substrate-binding protein
METRARYILIGLFTLAVIGAGFGFVYWLHHSGGLGERATYLVRFESAVSGLRVGSSVLFNGMRVGEVTALRLDTANPRHVTATIVVERGTPVRADTHVGMETQGLMGSPSILLRGGNPAAPAVSAIQGQPPVLVADPAALQDTMQAARQVLRHIDQVVVDNAEPLRSTIANINTFSGALARNSDRLDGIVEGLERLTGAGPSKTPPRSYELVAAVKFPGLDKVPSGQLGIADPTAPIALDTQKILVTAETGTAAGFPDAQWPDTIPKLVQAKIIQSFENAGYVRVGRLLEGPGADRQLQIDVRSFRIVLAPETVADVELGAKLLDGTGKIVDGRSFHVRVPAKAADAASATASINEAFAKAAAELVIWTTARAETTGDDSEPRR